MFPAAHTQVNAACATYSARRSSCHRQGERNAQKQPSRRRCMVQGIVPILPYANKTPFLPNFPALQVSLARLRINKAREHNGTQLHYTGPFVCEMPRSQIEERMHTPYCTGLGSSVLSIRLAGRETSARPSANSGGSTCGPRVFSTN